MTLLRLSPDSERLRRIAKAHAAGELSTPDYRRIRAEVIERFRDDAGAEHGDDTEPRWHERPAAARIKTDPSVEVDIVRPVPRVRGWWLVLAAAAAVLVIVIGSTAAWGSSIPPVKQRDPNPATSERMPVGHLQIRNFVAFLELGITAKSVDAVLDAALADPAKASQPGPSGFTAAELAEIGMFLKSIGAADGQPLKPSDAARANVLIASQKETPRCFGGGTGAGRGALLRILSRAWSAARDCVSAVAERG